MAHKSINVSVQGNSNVYRRTQMHSMNRVHLMHAVTMARINKTLVINRSYAPMYVWQISIPSLTRLPN